MRPKVNVQPLIHLDFESGSVIITASLSMKIIHLLISKITHCYVSPYKDKHRCHSLPWGHGLITRGSTVVHASAIADMQLGNEPETITG